MITISAATSYEVHSAVKIQKIRLGLLPMEVNSSPPSHHVAATLLLWVLMHFFFATW